MKENKMLGENAESKAKFFQRHKKATICIVVLLILGMLAFLSLNAITLCISAYQDSMFGAVVATAICWAIPLLVRIFFGGFVWILVDSMPMFLIMQVNLNDIYSIWYVVAVIAVGVLAVSLTKGILHYKVKQVV